MDLGIIVTGIAVVLIWIQRNGLATKCSEFLIKSACRINPLAYFQRSLLKIADREALLRKRVEILEEYSHTPIIITNSLGELIWANQAYCNLIGIPLEKTLGFNWSNAIYQQDREAVIKGWQMAVKNESDWVYKFRIWSFSRSQVIWVFARCFVATNKMNKKPSGWVATLIEINEVQEKHKCLMGHFTPPIS